MASPSFTTEIMDVFTFPVGDPFTKKTVWRRGDRIFLCAIHRIDPLMDLPYQVIFFIRRAFHLGYSGDSLYFDVLWEPAAAVSSTGRYGTRAPAILSYYDLPAIPPSPARPLDDALRSATDRRALFDGLVEGEFGQSTFPSYWSLVAMVLVFDPDMPRTVLNFEVSQPWYYYIKYR